MIIPRPIDFYFKARQILNDICQVPLCSTLVALARLAALTSHWITARVIADTSLATKYGTRLFGWRRRHCPIWVSAKSLLSDIIGIVGGGKLGTKEIVVEQR